MLSLLCTHVDVVIDCERRRSEDGLDQVGSTPCNSQYISKHYITVVSKVHTVFSVVSLRVLFVTVTDNLLSVVCVQHWCCVDWMQ